MTCSKCMIASRAFALAPAPAHQKEGEHCRGIGSCMLGMQGTLTKHGQEAHAGQYWGSGGCWT